MTHEQDRPNDDIVPTIPEEIEGININNSEEPGFEMVTTVRFFNLYGLQN